MKIGLVIILSLVISELATAQVKYDVNWVFGSNAWVDFRDTSHPFAKYEPCFTYETSASISDAYGDLILYISSANYFSGFWFNILDGSGSTIGNGDSINTNIEESNGACFIPVPSRPAEYYLFYLGTVFDENGYYQIPEYSYIIFDSANAQYSVAKKNIILTNQPVEQRMALVKHANGIDWWLFVRGGGLTWYSFLVTKDSIEGPYYQQIGILRYASLSSAGCMTFSSTGQYMADAVFDQNAVELFDFDRCSGLLSNCRPLLQVGIDTSTYSVEFSPDETKLYASLLNPYSNISEVYQYNVAEDVSLMHKQMIWSTDSLPAATGQLQLAPDNKIYIAVSDRNHCCQIPPDTFYTIYNQYLWRINTPDSSGAKCNFQPFALYLGDSSRSYDGLPNMPNFNLGALQNSLWQSTISNDTFICTNIDTPTKGVFISVDTMPEVTVTWQSAPGISNINATRQLVDPPQSTWYYVTFTDTSLRGTCTSRTDSVYVQVLICDTMGIQQVAQSNKHLSIYPNPAQKIATIEWQPMIGQDWFLAIYDLLGRQISDQKVDGITGNALLDISDLSNGLYVVKLYARNETAMSGKLAVGR